MNTHLQTAFNYGRDQALKKCGYASVEEVEKHAAELGLVAAPAPVKTAGDLDDVFKSLKAKLG